VKVYRIADRRHPLLDGTVRLFKADAGIRWKLVIYAPRRTQGAA